MNKTIRIFGLPVWSVEERNLENPSVSLSDPSAVDILFGDQENITGEKVNEETATSFTAVWRAVSLLGGTIASLPFNLIQEIDNKKIIAKDNPLYNTIHNEPNPLMTSYIYRETSVAHLLLHGDSFSIINRARGNKTTLELVHPKHVDIRVDRTGVHYKVDGTNINYYDILHVPGLSFDGIRGKTPLQVHRESIGYALTMQKFGAYFYKNRANIGGVVEHPGAMTDAQYNRFRKSWTEAYAKATQSGKTAILEGGAKYQALGMNMEDAQYLQSRKFQVAEIARIFGIPLHMLSDLDRSTNNNIEHQAIEYVKHTVLYWVKRIEQEFNRKLIPASQRETLYTKFNLEGLLRGDLKTRAEYYTKATGGRPWMAPDEVRDLENLEKLGGEASELITPLNFKAPDQTTDNNNTQNDE